MSQQTQADNPAVSKEEALLLKQAFTAFEENSKRLEGAYLKMQEDFKSLNLQLDAKNEELRQSLEETDTTRERLNCILESLQSGVIVVDVGGKVIHLNRAAEMTGLKAKQLMGKKYKGGVPHSKMPRGLLSTLKSGKEIHNEERELKKVDGAFLPVSYSASLVKNNEGKVLGAVEVFHDISKMKEMEREIQQARTLAALGEMSATVAHEIRNPLGGIGTYAALLERDLESRDPRRKLVRSIMEGIASLNKIVTNLLVYTRPMRGDFRRVCLNDLAKEIADFALLEIEQENREKIGIATNFPKKEMVSRIDPEKVQQLMLNLLFNAAQAMPKGGLITVELRQVKKPPDKLNKNNVHLWNRIAVKDRGVGIDKDSISKLFNPFFTTKENGTGLGLAIVQRIAEFHGGGMNVKSQNGKGATFEFYVPAEE